MKTLFKFLFFSILFISSLIGISSGLLIILGDIDGIYNLVIAGIAILISSITSGFLTLYYVFVKNILK